MTLLITFAAVVGVLLTVAGIVGAWLAVRTGQNTQTVRNFQDAAASWREKAESVAADLLTVQTELAALRAAHDKLQQAYNTLRDVVTGRSALEALSVQLDEAKKDITLEIRLSKDALHTLIESTRTTDSGELSLR